MRQGFIIVNGWPKRRVDSITARDIYAVTFGSATRMRDAGQSLERHIRVSP